MAVDVPLRCTCGAIRGVARDASGQSGNRAVCFCDDCQAFAHVLGRADEILDRNAGTDIFQTTPDRIEIDEGLDQLRCMRLTDRGILRWHSGCCRTPVANTLASRQVPFVGIIHSFMDHEGHGASREQDLGPVRIRVFGRFARGDITGIGAHPGGSPAFMLRMSGRMLADRIRGRHLSTPFFDPDSGTPRVVPHVLSADERRAVQAARDAAV